MNKYNAIIWFLLAFLCSSVLILTYKVAVLQESCAKFATSAQIASDSSSIILRARRAKVEKIFIEDK